MIQPAIDAESELARRTAVRQPDTDSFRLWEVAGTAHASNGTAEEATARQLRDFGEAPTGLALPAEASPNTLSFAPVSAAALHHMDDWIQGGPPAPAQARVEFDGDPPAIDWIVEGAAFVEGVLGLVFVFLIALAFRNKLRL